MAKINSAGFGRARRRNYRPSGQVDPMNPLRREVTDARGVERGLRNLAGLFMGAQEEDDKQVLKNNLYDDKRAIRVWVQDQQHELSIGLDQTLHAQRVNPDGFDLEAVVDGTMSRLSAMDDEVLGRLSEEDSRKTFSEAVADRDKHLRGMLLTRGVVALTKRHDDAFQETVAQISTTVNNDGIVVPRTDWSPMALLEVLQPHINELSLVHDGLVEAGVTDMDLASAQGAYDKALMSGLMAWSSEAHSGGRNLGYYLGLLGDNVKVKTDDGSERTVVLDKDLSNEDAQLLGRLFLGEDPTHEDVEKLKSLAAGGQPKELGAGFRTLLLQAGLPEGVIDQWISNEVGNMHQDMRKLLGDKGAAAGVLNVAAGAAGQAVGVVGTGSGGPEELESILGWFSKQGIDVELFDGVIEVLGESGENVANITTETINAGGQVLGLMRGQRPDGPISLHRHLMTEPSMQGMFSALVRTEIDRVATRIGREAAEPGTWTKDSAPSVDDVAAAYAEVASNYANNNNQILPHFLMADLLNSFGNAGDPLNAVLGSFLDNHWDRNDRWKIRKSPSKLTTKQKEAAAFGGALSEDYFIGDGYGIAALLSDSGVSMAMLEVLHEGNRALSEITGEDGLRMTLAELHREAQTRPLRELEKATKRLNETVPLPKQIVDAMLEVTHDESPGLVSPSDPVGWDYGSEVLNTVSFGWWGDHRGLVGTPRSDWSVTEAQLKEMVDSSLADPLKEAITVLEMRKPGTFTTNEGASAVLKTLALAWVHHAVRPFRFGPQSYVVGQRSSMVVAGNIRGTEGMGPDELRPRLTASVFNHFASMDSDKWDPMFREDDKLKKQVDEYSDSDRVYTRTLSGGMGGVTQKTTSFSAKKLVEELASNGWSTNGLPLPKLLAFYNEKLEPESLLSPEYIEAENVAWKKLTKNGARSIHLIPDGSGGAIVGVKHPDAPSYSPPSAVYLGSSTTPLRIPAEVFSDRRPPGVRLMEEAGATPEQIDQVINQLTNQSAGWRKERRDHLIEKNRRTGGY